MRGSEAAQFYEARQAEAMSLISSYNRLEEHLRAKIHAVTEQIAAARLELAQAYLTGLTEEALKQTQHLTGFLGFERRDPLRAMAHENTVLENTVKQIEANESYRDRELLVGPDGTLSTKLVEIDEMLGPWLEECKKYEQHEGFLELIQVKYDTPEFSEKWWQSSYWKHWAWGDRICDALGVGDFGDDILPAYNRAAEQRAFWQLERNNLTSQITVIHRLIQNHDQAVAGIPELPRLYLEQCQGYLGEYLEQADASLLEKWLTERLGKNRPILAGLRKLAGLKAKHGYYVELQNTGLRESLEGLRQRAAKFARKTQKYLRGKHYYRQVRDGELDTKFASKYSKYQQRPGKLRKLLDRIDAYDDYETFDLSNDPALWWFAMTNKKPPRQWGTTRRWYDRRPSFQIARDDDFDSDDDDLISVSQAVAVATSARDLDEVGYLS